MSARLFIVERGEETNRITLSDGRVVHMSETPVGAMWACECHDRRGWMIRLPDNPGADPTARYYFPNVFCTLLGDAEGRRWDVSGEAPNLTISPSIFCDPPSGWHGWIRDGVIEPA